MRRRMPAFAAVCAAAIVIVAGGVASAATGAAAASAPVTKIVYASQNGGIWLVNVNGTGDHEISTVTPDGVSFSPDGANIAYEASGEIWTMSVSGGAAHQVTHAGGKAFGVAWSPNGRWIAYSAPADTGSDIFRIPAGGGAASRLTYAAEGGCYDSEPAWSADSESITYVRADCAGDRADGLVVQRLGQKGTVVVSGPVQSPSFTPVGNLVYIDTCDIAAECSDATVSYEANADGTDPIIIDYRDDCRLGNLCQDGILGTPRVHGWVQFLAYAAEDGSIVETCVQGGYQKAGTLMDMPPSFCLNDVLTDAYDVS